MTVSLYMDVHVRRAVTVALRVRGVDVLTLRKTARRVFPTQRFSIGRPRSAGYSSRRTMIFSGRPTPARSAARIFAGVIYAHQLRIRTGQLIGDLELLAKVGEPEDFANRVEYLPLT